MENSSLVTIDSRASLTGRVRPVNVRAIALTVLVIFQVLGGMTVCFAEAGETRDFLRVSRNSLGQPVALETAIVTYEGKVKGKNVKVSLVSAVHLAEKSYYSELNREFRKYDAVLYELIAPEGHVPGGSGDAREQANPVSVVQRALTNALGLTFQLDEVDYRAKNFVHADLTPDQFVARMKARDENILAVMLKIFRVALEEQEKNPRPVQDMSILFAFMSPDREKALRRAFAEEFENLEVVFSSLDGPQGSTILTERNQAAINVLRDQLERGHDSVAIFYGAAHMPDFSRRLESELGLRKSGTTWRKAWNLAAQ